MPHSNRSSGYLFGRIAAAWPATAVALLYGCAAAPDSARGGQEPAPTAERPLGEPVATFVDARPAALVNGRQILWGDLRPALSDLAGAAALRETLLDRRLAELARDAGISVTDDDVAAEQQTLLATLSDDPATALRLLDELRARQALGRVRYDALLRRNAIMRALVRDRVEVDEPAIARLFDAMHGPKRQVRLLVTADLVDAQAARRDIEAGSFFGDVAAERSTDSSAARGGLLAPVSRADPTYPAALQEAIWSLAAPGATSAPVLLENGYAIVQLVREIPADGATLEPEREKLARLVRLAREREQMDALARRILADAHVVIFDDELRESWERAR
jgi:parvulin-like peptidyl-prolyl isomerase